MGPFSWFKKKDSAPKPKLSDIFEDPGGDMEYNRQLNEAYQQEQREAEEQQSQPEESSTPSADRCYYCGAELDSDGDCPKCNASNYKYGSSSL